LFDVHVGELRLDIWKNGAGVVSRPRRSGEVSGCRIPVDPSVRDMIPVLGAFGLGSVAASVITCAGAVGLFQAEKTGVAIGVLVVAVALAFLGGVWSLGWLIPSRRSHFVTLSGTAVDLFKQAAEDERLALGESPQAENLDAASDRLWEFACRLAGTNQGDGHRDG
jgi:hypothetical protein